MGKELENKGLKETQLKDSKLSDEALDNVAGGLEIVTESPEPNGVGTTKYKLVGTKPI